MNDKSVGWQFFEGGQWWTGFDTNNHRENTEAAGIPVRDVYLQPECYLQEKIEELETELEKSDKIAWEHFYIHQEVFNYLLSQGYIDDVVDGDNGEAAAQNIINGIKNIEGRLK